MLTQFLKDMFTATSPPCPRATSDDCSRSRWPATRPVEVCWYRCEMELHDIWRSVDVFSPGPARLSAILVLGGFLRGNLRELIHRRHLAQRLVIVPRPGSWPGVDSFGDLALAPRSLGWSSIELCRNLEFAPNVSDSESNGRVLIVLPVPEPSLEIM